MKKILALTSIVLIANLCGLSLLLLFNSYRKSTSVEEERKVVYVDSVWVKGPGQINTMQVDPIYFARTTEGNVHQSRSKVQIGDSFVYIYRRIK
jgi:hypothetical protein